jgi:hypothetical protein
VLVGNKTDLPPEVEESDAEAFAGTYGVSLFHTSAITGEGVEPLFATLSERIVKTCSMFDINPSFKVSGEKRQEA